MTRMKKTSWLFVLGIAAVLIAALVGAPTLRASLTGSDANVVVMNQTSTDAADGSCSQTPPGVSEVPGCKDCKDRPLCTCRYNGHPRVSCNPCCYSTPTGLICRD